MRALILVVGLLLLGSVAVADEIDAAIELLGNGNDAERFKACIRLRDLRKRAERAVPDLRKAPSDSSFRVRCAAADALAARDTKVEKAPGAGLVLQMRTNCIEALEKFPAEELVPAAKDLGRALRLPEKKIRQQVITLVTGIGPKARGATPALTRLAEGDESEKVRAAAREALAAVSGGASEGNRRAGHRGPDGVARPRRAR